MNLNNLKISTRLGLCFFMILLLAFIATGFAQWRLALTASETKLMMEQPLAKERMISDWYRLHSGWCPPPAALHAAVIPRLPVSLRRCSVTMKGATEMRDKIEPLLTTDEEKRLFSDITEQGKIYTAAKIFCVPK
jgi:methyl-accepting chemotaxis protein